MAKDGKKSTNKSKKKSTTANCSAKKSRPKPEDNITKSKKLTEKIKNGRHNSNLKSSRFDSRTTNDNTRVCENGKPMPSLSDLEKMFEDSDDDTEPKIVSQKENNVSSSAISSEKLTSPKTIKKIADRMMEMISNLPSVNDYSPPIIPPKKRKKNKNIDEERPRKHLKRNKSDDVAIWLKDCEKTDYSDGSTDSNKTVDYDLSKSPCVNGRPQSFSPLPSTSRDRETITRNDQLFNESLLSETTTNDNELTIINSETKADTDLKLSSNYNKSLESNIVNATEINDDIKIMESPCETIVIDDDFVINKPVIRKNIKENISDCIEILEPDIKKESLKLQDGEAITIDDDDDYYKSIDYNPIPDEATEVIDIDDIIAENKAIIKKYSKDTDNDINTVTCVDSTTITNSNNKEESKIEANRSNLKKKTNTVVITDDSSSTQNQDNLQAIVTNFFSKESHPEAETPRETTEVPVLQRFRDWLLGLNSANAHNTSRRNIQNENSVIVHGMLQSATNNSPNIHSSRSKHSSNAQFVSRNTNQNEHVILIDDLSSPANENSDQDDDEICNKNHRHHTTSQHRHIFQNTESRHGNMDHGSDLPSSASENSDEDGYETCNKNHRHHTTSQHRHIFQNTKSRHVNHDHSHRHHTSSISRHINQHSRSNYGNMSQSHRINNDQHYDASLYERCRKCHHYGCPDGIKNRQQNYSDNINRNNRSNINAHKQPSVQKKTPVATKTTVNPPASPAKNLGDCPICLDSLAKNSVASTICGHVFCLKCIEAALRTSGRRCPTCRKTLKKGGYHQIFL